jgi:predicted HTH transcriptional regulator
VAKTLNQKLLEVGEELRELTEKFDALMGAIGLLEDSGKGPGKKTARKKPSTKKAASKKAAPEKTATRKAAAAKSPATKKSVKKPKAQKQAKKAAPKKKTKTALETVLMYIKRTKKGLTTEALMKKTGYDKKKVSNTIYKLKKQGKIVAAERGTYVKA